MQNIEYNETTKLIKKNNICKYNKYIHFLIAIILLIVLAILLFVNLSFNQLGQKYGKIIENKIINTTTNYITFKIGDTLYNENCIHKCDYVYDNEYAVTTYYDYKFSIIPQYDNIHLANNPLYTDDGQDYYNCLFCLIIYIFSLVFLIIVLSANIISFLCNKNSYKCLLIFNIVLVNILFFIFFVCNIMSIMSINQTNDKTTSIIRDIDNFTITLETNNRITKNKLLQSRPYLKINDVIDVNIFVYFSYSLIWIPKIYIWYEYQEIVSNNKVIFYISQILILVLLLLLSTSSFVFVKGCFCYNLRKKLFSHNFDDNPNDICSNCNHSRKNHIDFKNKCDYVVNGQCLKCKHKCHTINCNKPIGSKCVVCDHTSHNNECHETTICSLCKHAHNYTSVCHHIVNTIKRHLIFEPYQSPIYKKIKVMKKVEKHRTIQTIETIDKEDSDYEDIYSEDVVYTSNYGQHEVIAVTVPVVTREYTTTITPTQKIVDKDETYYVDEEVEKETSEIIGYETKYREKLVPDENIYCECKNHYDTKCYCNHNQKCDCNNLTIPLVCNCKKFVY